MMLIEVGLSYGFHEWCSAVLVGECVINFGISHDHGEVDESYFSNGVG